MARIRTVKPEFWDDEKLATISRDARLLFIAMWNFSDDYGVVKGHPSWLKNKVFPYDDIKQTTFNEWILCLEKLRAIIAFDHNGEKYYYIRTFGEHQKVDRPSATRNPEAPADILESNRSLFDEGSTNTRRGLPVVREGKVREGRGREDKIKHLDSVFLTEGELKKLKEDHGESLTREAIEILNAYIMSSGKKYKSHYHTIIQWPIEKAREKLNQPIQGANNGRYQNRNRIPEPVEREVQEGIDRINRMAREIAQKTSLEKT